MNIQQFLERHQVGFEVIPHTEAFDAAHVAQATATPGGEVAKTVLLRVDHGYQYVIAIVPATHRIDLEAVSRLFGGAQVYLASELEVNQRCPDCEAGVLSPFGSQYGAETILDNSLAQHEQILFEGKNHHEAIRMKYADFCRIENPTVAQFAVHV